MGEGGGRGVVLFLLRFCTIKRGGRKKDALRLNYDLLLLPLSVEVEKSGARRGIPSSEKTTSPLLPETQAWKRIMLKVNKAAVD